MNFFRSKFAAVSLSWKSLFLAIVLASGAYMFMEWLFIVTKPSFMDTLPLLKKLEVLLSSSFLLAGLFTLPLLLFLIISKIPWFRAYTSLFLNLLAILPAILAASTVLLMLDNFTYTMFKFGIVSSMNIARGLYLTLYLVMIAYFYKDILLLVNAIGKRNPNSQTKWVLLTGCLLLISNGLVFLTQSFENTGWNPTGSKTLNLTPDILIITSDGVSADHMSIYGYERETTPRIKEFAEHSLLMENAFSNSGNTAGSLTSLFTSKYPMNTRVLYPPDILKGSDAYQHLPGLLRAQQYYTIQYGYPHYVDAFTLNFLNGFNVVNGQTASSRDPSKGIGRYMPYEVSYFLYETGDRIASRLSHIFFLQKMENPYDLVTETPDQFNDQVKVQQLIELLNTSKQPLFVHLHLMGTHGPKYTPPQQVFSKGQQFENQEEWNTDFYDDTILQFDHYVAEIIDALIENGKYDNTILVVGSDHGQRFNHMTRIPMIIRFPGDAFAGRIRANFQMIDLAPTILDYLEIAKPNWMQGESFLHGQIEQRPIFGTSIDTNLLKRENGTWWINTEKSSPPFYQFKILSMIYCQRLYTLNLVTREWYSKDINRSTANCAPEDLKTDAEALPLIIAHLKNNGFNTSSLIENGR